MNRMTSLVATAASVLQALPVVVYAISYTLLKVLEQAGNDMSRENIMAQAPNLKYVHVPMPMLVARVLLNTSVKDFFPLEQMQLQRFNTSRGR